MNKTILLLMAGLTLGLVGCKDLKQIGGDGLPPVLAFDPVDFGHAIENPYFPLKPGTTYVYEGTTQDGLERVEVRVTNQTRLIMGVVAIVVRDTVTLDGEVVEDTYDWYAQDNQGNVWYLGEDAKEFDDGLVVNTEGSWEAGVDGALPGVVMLAQPKVGDAYRQEYRPGVAEDMAEVLNLNSAVTVAYGSFQNVLLTREWTPLEPGTIDHKHYAAGVGLIYEVQVQGGNERLELVEVQTQP